MTRLYFLCFCCLFFSIVIPHRGASQSFINNQPSGVKSLAEFIDQSDDDIWENLYKGVNERCYALLSGYDENSNEFYFVNPIPPLYEIANIDDVYYEVQTNDQYFVTNYFQSFEYTYPASATGYYWSANSMSEYGASRPVLFRPIHTYSRYAWYKSYGDQSNAIMTKIDLGFEIHKKIAELIASGFYLRSFNYTDIIISKNDKYYGLKTNETAYLLVSENPVDVLNEAFETAQEWNYSALQVEYWHNYSDFACDDPRALEFSEWRPDPPPEMPIGLLPSQEPSQPDECWGIRLVPNTNNTAFIPRDIKPDLYYDKYPALTERDYAVFNRIASVASNDYTVLYNPPKQIVVNVYSNKDPNVYTQTQFVLIETISNRFISMTNYVYEYPYLLDHNRKIYLTNSTASSWIMFSQGNETITTNTFQITYNNQQVTEKEIIKEKYIYLNYYNNNTVNDWIADSAYSVDSIQSVPQNVFVYRYSDTNGYYNSIESYDLPEIYELTDTYYRDTKTNLFNGSGSSTNFPVSDYSEIIVDIDDVVNITTANSHGEEYSNARRIIISPTDSFGNAGDSGDFEFVDERFQYKITEKTYLYQTNLNSYYEKFPVHDAIIYTTKTYDHLVSPVYQDINVDINDSWLWQKYIQLSMMRRTRVTYSNQSQSTNFLSSILFDINYNNENTTTNISASILESLNDIRYEPIDVQQFAQKEKYTIFSDAQNKYITSGFERYNTIGGKLSVYKSTNVAGTISVIAARRYAENRFGLPVAMLGLNQNFLSKAKYSIDCFNVRSETNVFYIAGYTITHEISFNGQDLFVNQLAYASTNHFLNLETKNISIEWDLSRIPELGTASINDIQKLPETQIECGGRIFYFPGGTVGSDRSYYDRKVNSIIEFIWDWDFEYP